MTYNALNILITTQNNMKLIRAIFLLHLIVVTWLGVFITPVYAGDSMSLEIPPAVLEKWYKPANKRQVWLHTMFRLRREMQAIDEYTTLK